MNSVKKFSLQLTSNKSLYRKFSVNKREDVIGSVNVSVRLKKLACRRCGGVVVSALEDHSLPWCCFLRQKMFKNPTFSLSTEAYKWVPATYCWE